MAGSFDAIEATKCTTAMAATTSCATIAAAAAEPRASEVLYYYWVAGAVDSDNSFALGRATVAALYDSYQ